MDRLDLREIVPIIQEVSHCAPQYAPTKTQMDSYLDQFYRSKCLSDVSPAELKGMLDSLIRRIGCTVASREFAISPDGLLLPCRAFYYKEFSAGKLNGTNFSQLWEQSEVLATVRRANNTRIEVCREAECDFFSLCLGGCLAHSYSLTGALKPFASNEDCYRYKQEIMTRMRLKLMNEKSKLL